MRMASLAVPSLVSREVPTISYKLSLVTRPGLRGQMSTTSLGLAMMRNGVSVNWFYF